MPDSAPVSPARRAAQLYLAWAGLPFGLDVGLFADQVGGVSNPWVALTVWILSLVLQIECLRQLYFRSRGLRGYVFAILGASVVIAVTFLIVLLMVAGLIETGMDRFWGLT